MLHNTTALQKGLITGIAMIAAALAMTPFVALPLNGPHQYVIYAIYAAGIVWTLLSFAKKGNHDGKLKTFFNEGFRCFVVATLLMVIFTWIFLQFNTTLQDDWAKKMQEDLTKEGNKTPTEITAQIAQMRKYLPLVRTSGAVFFNLIIGVILTLVTGAYLTRNKN